MHRRVLALLAAVSALALATPALASGFAVNEQSVRGLGRAYSGETVVGDDAAGLWYNPALSGVVDRPTATLGVSGVFSRGKLKDGGTTLTNAFGTRRTGGPNGDDPLDPAAVPSGSVAIPLRDGWSVGASVNVPWGLTTAYNSNYFGRYDSTRTELATVNIGVSAAKRFGDFTIGVGLDGQYADAVLESALPNIAPGAPDGFLQVKGDDWSLGYHVGTHWTPTPRFAFAASYRSAIKHTLDGDERISGLVGPLAAGNRAASGEARLKTPDVARIGAAFTPRPDITLMGQINWFGWSNFDAIVVRSPGAADLVREQRYQDSVSASAGVEVRPTTRLAWRTGVMLEQTPTRAPFRSTRVPDGDRIWLTAGASYMPTTRTSLDVGLAYVAIEKTRVERTDTFFDGTAAATRLDVAGSIQGDALIVGLGGSLRF